MTIPIACSARLKPEYDGDPGTGVTLRRDGDQVIVTMTWDGTERGSLPLSVEAVRLMLDGFTPNADATSVEDVSPPEEGASAE